MIALPQVLRSVLPLGLLIALALAVAGCAAPENRETNQSSGSALRSVLREAQNQPESRAASEVFCLLSISQSDNDFPYEAFFAGLFSVEEARGDRAFCSALIDAVIAGEVTEADLAPFDKPAQLRGKEPLGTLLRKLMVAHLRISTQEATGARQGSAAPAS